MPADSFCAKNKHAGETVALVGFTLSSQEANFPSPWKSKPNKLFSWYNSRGRNQPNEAALCAFSFPPLGSVPAGGAV